MLCIKCLLQIVRGLEHLISKGARLYVSVDIKGTIVGQTRLVEYVSNPCWDEQVRIYCAHMASNVAFTLEEHGVIDTFRGKAHLPVTNIIGGEEVETWLDILDSHGRIIKKGFKLHVKVLFNDATLDSNWNSGVKTLEFDGVPSTFFKQEKQCKVTLYQDANVDDNFVPKIPLTHGKYYEPQRCWKDIFNAITNAKHFIYIAGWSVNTNIRLIRNGEKSTSLGDLLVQKADQKVTVLVLVWKDKTSMDGRLWFNKGLMDTHADETYNFFKKTNVKCVLCPRNQDEGNYFTHFLFSHHQKTVIVDSELSSEKSEMRRIVSFLGGIDLCDGRYDTQAHSLFRTLSTSQAHHDDFHQPNFDGASIKKGGPREPWHDIHCKLEGPAAWDVLCNFEQRWRKQGTNADLVKVLGTETKFISRSDDIFSDDHESWNVQVFRSIDGQAALGFPDSPEKAAGKGLLSGKDGVIERSIQDAYIHAIRRAKRFIYIENQYFIGSSFDWKEKHLPIHGDIGAFNLIPKELSLKIVSKIEKGERFTVYVVLPMWPEGKPDSYSVQDMLRWQRNTMEMMYNDVAKALQAQNSKDKPEDYLLFFCLGNREAKLPGEYEPPERPKPDTDYGRAQAARRFMIYVHSKMMIGNSLLEIKHTSIFNTSIKFDIN